MTEESWLWECYHVSLNVLTAPPLRSTEHCTGTAGAGGPERGRFGWSVEALYAVRAGWLERWMVTPKRAVLCTANFSGPLGQQQARFGGQRAGSRPS
jgi:hypothetical protein